MEMDAAGTLISTFISSDRAALHNKGSAALYRHTAAAGLAANTSSELTGIAPLLSFRVKVFAVTSRIWLPSGAVMVRPFKSKVMVFPTESESPRVTLRSNFTVPSSPTASMAAFTEVYFSPPSTWATNFSSSAMGTISTSCTSPTLGGATVTGISVTMVH